MNRDVIIACDFPNRETTLAFLDRFEGGRKPYVKIGMELFYGTGPDMVREIKARGHKIFLDLKLHDIPNTVKKAMQVLSALDVDMVNVHASGTVAMMKAALEGLTRPDGTRPLLIAVTQLTSTSEEVLHKDLLVSASMNDTIAHYAANAKEAGLDGVVCSPLEAGLVKATCGKDFLTITPGIVHAHGELVAFLGHGMGFAPVELHFDGSKMLTSHPELLVAASGKRKQNPYEPDVFHRGRFQ